MRIVVKKKLVIKAKPSRNQLIKQHRFCIRKIQAAYDEGTISYERWCQLDAVHQNSLDTLDAVEEGNRS